ncbi:MAG TPA: DUF1735 domain-containing protein, partial [Chitinophagaceae bacterium]|nr:DUF1735 domain-containing protein [Chitinophagaceae bacterium]
MRHIKIFLLFFTTVICFSGCLKKDDATIDVYNLSAPVYTMEWIQPGGTTVNSGLQYFANGALTYPASHTADTASFAARLTGGDPAASDITITIAPDTKVLLDNFSKDSITYEAMPDSLYKFISNTGTIKKGTSVAYFKVIFYPSKISPAKNYMLAPAVTSPADHEVSKNFGHIYFHTIGNPLAGAYTTTGKRYNYTTAVPWSGPPAAFPAGSTDGTTAAYNSTVIAAPVNTKTIKLIMGNIPLPGVADPTYYNITGNSN